MTQNRDRLDGTEKQSKYLELFLAPGRFFLWVQYMFPGKSYRDIRMSSRHARSPIMTYLYSLLFWAFLFYILVVALIELVTNF